MPYKIIRIVMHSGIFNSDNMGNNVCRQSGRVFQAVRQ